jgi:GTP-binding protein
MPLTVAIVGRPNVGKSTLFNRLAGKRLAIVDDTPGVTRDRRIAESDFGGLALRLIDTAGFEQAAADTLQARMVEQTRAAIADANVALFVIDAREGVTAGDEAIADVLRRAGKPVVLAANKSEGAAAAAGQAEGYRLGFGEPIALSAEHAVGLSELYDALAPFAAEAEARTGTTEANQPLHLAIVGRPNVGKSSLLNRLIGEERALVGPEPGVTRDAVAAEWRWQDRDILIHDTAGLRKKARIEARLEKLSVESTLHAIRFAECAIVVIDATQPFEKQDLVIADLIEREGRAIVFAVNKWDLVAKRQGGLSALRESLDRLLPQLAGAPLVALSARTGEGMERLMPAVMAADRAWNTRVQTSDLNRFLAAAQSRHPPPAVKGRRIRLRYMTQPKARPPNFVLFGNQLNALPDAWLRYLTNGLRDTFKLHGAPIRLTLRTSKNPYAE